MFVDAANRLVTAASNQRFTAHRMPLRAVHAHAVTVDFMRERIGHAAAERLQFVDGKFDTISVAAGTAGDAGMGLGFGGHDVQPADEMTNGQ